MRIDLLNLGFESTLENVEISSCRRSGNTTRLVDRAIQILFERKVCIVQDHHKNGSNTFSNRKLLGLITDRLLMEHNIDTDGYEIELTDPIRIVLKSSFK